MIPTLVKRGCVLAGFTLMIIAAQLNAMVKVISIEKLVEQSDFIVIAKVSSVEPVPGKGGEERFANARVLETWKGNPTETIKFSAYPTWQCDVSGAEKDETVVLFLQKDNTSPFLFIAHSGRGRLAVETTDGKKHVKLTDISLPEGTVTREKGRPELLQIPIRTVELSTLKKLVMDAKKEG
jgi:hypothetical protein